MSNLFPYLAALGLLLGVLALDIATPLGVPDWLFYILIYFILFRWLTRPFVLTVCALSTFFTLIGLYASPAGVTFQIGVINRATGIALIWITGWWLLRFREDVSVRREVEEKLKRSEKEYRNLFRKMQEAFAVVEVIREGTEAVDVRYLAVNQAFERYSGFTAELLIGRTYRDNNPEPDREWLDIICRVAVTGAPSFGERYSPVPDRWVLYHVYSPVRGQAAILLIDVTERKRAEEDRRESEERFRALSDAVPQLIWFGDGDGHMQYFNERWYDFTGQTVDESLEVGWMSALHPEDVPRAVEQWNRAKATGKLYEIEYRLRRKDGEYLWFLARGVAVRDETGTVTSWFGSCTDINEQRRTAERLRQIQERLTRTESISLVMPLHVSLDCRWLKVTQNFADFLGYSEEELLGRPFSEFTHPDDFEADRNQVQRLLSREIQSFEMENRFIRKDGSVIWGYLNCSLVTDEKDRPVHLLAYVLNIQRQKMAEEAVRQSEQLLRKVLETLPVGVWILDRNCNVILGNKAAREIWGASPKEVAAYHGWWLSTRKPVEINEWAGVRAVTKGEVTLDAEVEIACFDGSHKIILDSAIPIRDDSGEITGAITVNQEISDRKQAEEELRKAKDELEVRVQERTEELRQALNELRAETRERIQAVEELRRKEQLLIQQNRLAAMGEMIGNIAHQWRQPLNRLGLLVQDLAYSYDSGDLTPEHVRKTTEDAMKTVLHMSRTIDDFRNFFRPDKGQVSFRVNSVVESTVSFLEAGLKAQLIELKVLDEEEVFAEGYPNEFSHVILNLLMNAKDAILERQTPDPLITIRTFQEQDQPTVTVTDNAGGIAEEIMPKIFDPYFTTKGPDKGTGIGLFMSKTIIERSMNGSLTVRNTGVGAEFKIVLRKLAR